VASTRQPPDQRPTSLLEYSTLPLPNAISHLHSLPDFCPSCQLLHTRRRLPPLSTIVLPRFPFNTRLPSPHSSYTHFLLTTTRSSSKIYIRPQLSTPLPAPVSYWNHPQNLSLPHPTISMLSTVPSLLGIEIVKYFHFVSWESIGSQEWKRPWAGEGRCEG